MFFKRLINLKMWANHQIKSFHFWLVTFWVPTKVPKRRIIYIFQLVEGSGYVRSENKVFFLILFLFIWHYSFFRLLLKLSDPKKSFDPNLLQTKKRCFILWTNLRLSFQRHLNFPSVNFGQKEEKIYR